VKPEPPYLEWVEVQQNCRSAGLEVARVPGGWLYRDVRRSPAPHVTALAFVPDVKDGDKP
jgi:hypothetical protein